MQELNLVSTCEEGFTRESSICEDAPARAQSIVFITEKSMIAKEYLLQQ